MLAPRLMFNLCASSVFTVSLWCVCVPSKIHHGDAFAALLARESNAHSRSHHLLLFANTPAVTADGYGHVSFANSGARRRKRTSARAWRYSTTSSPAAAAAFRRAQSADLLRDGLLERAMTFNHPSGRSRIAGARAALNKLAPTARRGALKQRQIVKGISRCVEIFLRRRTRKSATSAMKTRWRVAGAIRTTSTRRRSTPRLWHSARGPRHTNLYASGGLLEAWMGHQEHPGLVHYLIRYDDPAHALGLTRANLFEDRARCGTRPAHVLAHLPRARDVGGNRSSQPRRDGRR